MTSDQRSRHVCSLTYHEITQDPRVFKQALALRKRGYRVTVLCVASPNRPNTEEIEGIEVRRFDAYGPDGASYEALAEVDYMDASRTGVMERLGPYLDLAAQYRNAVTKLNNAGIGASKLQRLEDGKRQYKSRRGPMRLVAKLAYHLEMSKTLRTPGSTGLERPELHKALLRRRDLQRQLRKARRCLDQANGYLFAMNLVPAVADLRPDLVHAHDIYCLPGGVAFAKRTGAKLLYDAHEYEPARVIRMKEVADDFAGTMELDCLRFVDRMTTVSRTFKDLYAKRFVGPTPDLIHNSPPQAPKVKGNLPDIRVLAGVDPSTPLLVFTGGVQRENRGLDRVLEAMSYLPSDVVLAVMGPRNERNDAWLLTAAVKHRMRERLRLIPSVPADKVVHTISAANAAVVATQDISLNQRFSMPNKLFEAAFAGVPLVVSDLPDMGSFVEELGIGTVMDPTDPRSIAEAIRLVLENPEDFKADDQAQARLHNEYSWPVQENTLATIVEELVELDRTN